MKPYTDDELIILSEKILNCLYSLYQSIVFARKAREYAVKKMNRPRVLDILGMYYIDHYFHELSELYTAFYKKKDQEILGKFNASEDQRNKLRNVRHPAVHVTDNIDEVIKADQKMDPATTSSTLPKDLILMAKHIRRKLKSVSEDQEFIERMRALIALYPSGVVPEEEKKDLLDE